MVYKKNIFFSFLVFIAMVYHCFAAPAVQSIYLTEDNTKDGKQLWPVGFEMSSIWHSMGIDTAYNIYVAVSDHKGYTELGGNVCLFKYDTKTGKAKYINSLKDASSAVGNWMNQADHGYNESQEKVHTKLVSGYMGRMYFATHDITGIDPWPDVQYGLWDSKRTRGSHIYYIDPATDSLVDYSAVEQESVAVTQRYIADYHDIRYIPNTYGQIGFEPSDTAGVAMQWEAIITFGFHPMVMDKVYGLTIPRGWFVVHDFNTGTTRLKGPSIYIPNPVNAWLPDNSGNYRYEIFRSQVNRTLPVDRYGNAYSFVRLWGDTLSPTKTDSVLFVKYDAQLDSVVRVDTVLPYPDGWLDHNGFRVMAYTSSYDTIYGITSVGWIVCFVPAKNELTPIVTHGAGEATCIALSRDGRYLWTIPRNKPTLYEVDLILKKLTTLIPDIEALTGYNYNYIWGQNLIDREGYVYFAAHGDTRSDGQKHVILYKIDLRDKVGPIRVKPQYIYNIFENTALSVVPNPFNAVMELRNADGRMLVQDAVIYELNGRLVKRISQGDNSASRIVWDGRDNDNKRMSGGQYLIKYRIGKKSFTKAVTYLR